MSSNKYSPFALPKDYLLHKRYVIKDVLGIGGFGITYKVIDIKTREVCAAKELFINDLVYRMSDGIRVHSNPGKESFFEHGILRFMEEAGILYKLSEVEGVVKLCDYFKENGTAYFVMEYIDGKTLAHEVKANGGYIEYNKAKLIIYKVAQTLDHIHTQYDIFHRDISPENILITKSEEPIIIDFGNAKHFIRKSGQSMSIVLKPGFAPPEQYTSKSQGPWTDVYSLAGVFYYICSGKKVPPAPDRLTGVDYESLSKILRECTDKISNGVDSCLALSVKDRIKTMKEFAEILTPTWDETSESIKQFPILNILSKGSIRERWRLPYDRKLVIGRSSQFSDIYIEDNNGMSKQHFTVFYSNHKNEFEVTDISANGTVVNGKKIMKGIKYIVSPDAIISFGNSRYSIFLEVK